MTKTRLRCSKLHMNIYCPSSMADGPQYQPVSQIAAEGTASHAAAAMIAAGQAPNIAAFARRHNVDPDTLSRNAAMMSKAWRELEQYFPAPLAEYPVIGSHVEGTTDLCSRYDETWCVLDWHFGHGPQSKRTQLLGYATAIREMEGLPDSAIIPAFHVRVQDGSYDVFHFTAEHSANLNKQITDAQKHIGKHYNPGPDTCTFCPHQLSCRARREYSQDGLSLLTRVDTDRDITDLQWSEAYPRFQLVSKALKRFEQALNMRLQDGPLQLGKGKSLELRDVARETILARQAWPMLTEALDADALAECITVKKSALEKAIGATAERGQKGKVIKAFLERLREIGAVTSDRFSRRFEVNTGGD